MQHQDHKTIATREVKQLRNALVLMLGLVTLWCIPFTQQICEIIDIHIFSALNRSLLYSHYWQLLWGYLNHPNETWLNIVFMISLNIIGIVNLPKAERPRAIMLFIYCWLSFQVVLLVTHKIFFDWLEIQRQSPSIVLTPWVILSETLGISNIKVYSHSSFPAGHVLVLIYWVRFSALYCKTWVRDLTIVTTVFLTLPRLISGAHWLSDIIFTIAYATVWFNLAIIALNATNLIAYSQNFRLYKKLTGKA